MQYETADPIYELLELMTQKPIDPTKFEELRREHGKTVKAVEGLGKRIDGINTRLAELHSLRRRTPQQWATENRRFVIGTAIALAALVVAFFTLIEPAIRDHLASDFHDSVKRDIASELSEPKADLKTISASVQKIDGEMEVLRPLIQDLLKKNIKAGVAHLDKEVETAQKEKKPVSPLLVGYLQTALQQTSESSPDYWPAVLKFLSVATAGLSPDAPPPGSMSIKASNAQDMRIDESYCTVELDGGSLINSHLDHCRVIFTENPVQLQNVVFTNCVFEMPVTAKPSPSLKQAARTLLAANLRSAKIFSLS